jgi:hypothetical protein
MALEAARVRLRRQLEETYGAEGAAILMDRPPGGWTDLVTNQTIDLKIDALRHELRSDMAELRSSLKEEIAGVRVDLAALSGSVDRRLRAQTWITTTTLVAGLALAFTAGRLG